VAVVPSGPSWTPPPTKRIKKKQYCVHKARCWCPPGTSWIQFTILYSTYLGTILIAIFYLYLIKQLNAKIFIPKRTISPDFMETEDSFQFPKEPATVLYPEPDESRPQIHIPFVEFEVIIAMIMKFYWGGITPCSPLKLS
jgi:hypothetical protein